MANEQQLNTVRDQVKKQVTDVLALPVKDWAMRPELCAINFANAIPVVERTRAH